MRDLPLLIGNDGQTAAAVRDPSRFFPLLDTLRIAHPPVSTTRPAEPGWLFKEADGCGGTHVVPAEKLPQANAPQTAAGRHGYFQRRASGRAFSALFVAARGRAQVLGFAEQLTSAIGDSPFVHTGSIGPVELPETLARSLREAIAAVTAQTGLTGLNSFDFLLDGEDFSLLEINARPSSTMALYEAAWREHWPFGLVSCHLDACLRGRLPSKPHGPPQRCEGQQVLFTPRSLIWSAALSDVCMADPGCRDVPMPGTRIEAGQPLVTLVATASSPDAVKRALDAQRTRMLERIDTFEEPDHVLLVKHG